MSQDNQLTAPQWNTSTTSEVGSTQQNEVKTIEGKTDAPLQAETQPALAPNFKSIEKVDNENINQTEIQPTELPTLENEQNSEESDNSKNQLEITFLGFDGECIGGLECRLKVANKTTTFTTDANGKLPTLSLETNTDIELAVKRLDGSFKVIDETTIPMGEASWEFVSPRLLLEVNTELHEGVSENAEQHAPKSIESDKGDLGTLTESNAIETKSSETKLQSTKPSTKKVASNQQAKIKANKIPAKISGQTPVNKKEALKNSRNANGHPQATFTSKVKDWWGSWRMPSLNIWSQKDFNLSKGATKAHQNSPTVYAEELKHVNELINYLTMQADYKFKDTVATLTKLSNGTFKHKHGEKEASKSIGYCYTYVKVALARTGWVNGALVGGSASTAGPQLIANGFVEVTDQLPDSRWAAPGDITVYSWTDAVMDTKPQGHANDGHIDVRSYDNYLTDHIPAALHPNWSRYNTPKVYRKFHDPLPILRMKAFLRCLREFECQAEHDDAKRYQMLNTPLPDTKEKYFTSFDTHPWDTVSKEKRSKYSAAGAYQIVYSTWLELLTGQDGQGNINLHQKMFSLESNEKKFTPELQDRMAIAKIENRKALGHVRTGNLIKAIEMLCTEWTSLPGGKENKHRLTENGKPMNHAYFEHLFNTYFNEEKKKAGIK